MADCWIINSSPLIVLGKAGGLHLLHALANTLIIPGPVALEIAQGPVNDPARLWLFGAGANFIVPCAGIPAHVRAFKLGAGESSVMAAATRFPETEVVIDDLAARRAAQKLGLTVRGTLAVILTARQRGLIPAAAPVLDEVRKAGLYLSDSLRLEALALVGE